MFYKLLITFLHSFVAWSGLAAYFLLARELGQASGTSRVVFVLLHYLAVVVSFGLVYFVFFRYFSYFNPFTTMAVGILSVFLIELVVFSYFYQGELWFLNFVDYIVPVFLAASTIYFVGKWFG